MNIRDVRGVSGPQELYELASHHQVHVGSMDKLVRFALEIQKRAIDSMKAEKKKRTKEQA